MQPSVTLPTTATAFINFMERVWDAKAEATSAGGLTLYASALYDEYHDAIRTAQRCGMVRTGGSPIGDDSSGQVYRFPLADDGVVIARNGSAIRPSRRRGGAH